MNQSTNLSNNQQQWFLFPTETDFSQKLTDSGMRLEKGEDGKFRLLQPKDQALNG